MNVPRTQVTAFQGLALAWSLAGAPGPVSSRNAPSIIATRRPFSISVRADFVWNRSLSLKSNERCAETVLISSLSPAPEGGCRRSFEWAPRPRGRMYRASCSSGCALAHPQANRKSAISRDPPGVPRPCSNRREESFAGCFLDRRSQLANRPQHTRRGPLEAAAGVSEA